MTMPAAAPGPARIDWKHQAERFALPFAWLLLIALFGKLLPQTFLSWRTISTMLGSQAVLVVLALALLIPLTAGDFDLSVASTMVFSSMLLAVLNVQGGAPVGLAIAAALGAGAVVGLANAGFILFFRIHSLIVTLGIGTFVNGLTLWLSNSRTISGISMDLVTAVVINRFLGVPMGFYYGIGVALAIWYFLELTVTGRKLLFVGRGREVARLNGIRVDRMRLGAFVAAGMLASLAGVLMAGTTGSADPISGLSSLLPAFAAAFLGATAINTGRFNPIGTVIAVYFLITGITGLTMLGASAYVQSLFYGGALVVAVALSQLVRNRQPQSFA